MSTVSGVEMGMRMSVWGTKVTLRFRVGVYVLSYDAFGLSLSMLAIRIRKGELEIMEYRRVSADCHLDLPWMPPELFTSEASADMKDRMPYVEDGPDGPQWVTKKGANFGLLNGVGPGGAKLVPGQNRRVDIMAETGMFEDGKKGIQRVSDPHMRAKEMDLDGVDAEVIFGILGSASKMQDPDAANEMFRIYNNWLKDFCSHYRSDHHA